MNIRTIATLALLSITITDAVGAPPLPGTPGTSSTSSTTPGTPPRTPPRRDENPEPVLQETEVCLYTGKLYTGANFCTGQEGFFKLSRYWKSKIRSMTISSAVVRICDSVDMKGECKTYSSNVDQIVPNLINKVQAVNIYADRH